MQTDLREQIHRLHAQLCSALADPSRILILYTLTNGHSNVSDLAHEIGLSQPSVSRHLKVLRESGLVFAQREGHSMIYQLADGRVVEALDLLRGMLADNLEKQASLARTASEDIKVGH
jgi:DNA-binding transcriptional ArsR family regulator